MPITKRTLSTIEKDEEDEHERRLLKKKIVIATLLLMEEVMGSRNEKHTRQRLDWNKHAHKLSLENNFEKTYRMSLDTFTVLIDLISPMLISSSPCQGEEPIIPEIMLHCTLRYLAGGSYIDIRQSAGISEASFYTVLWRTVEAINSCPTLAIELPTLSKKSLEEQAKCFSSILTAIASDGQPIFNGCVGCVDGYLQPFRPRSTDQTDLAVFLNGHYKQHGINCQAMCDSNCRFTFFSVMSPGSVNDVLAIEVTTLKKWINELPTGFYVVADNAYCLLEHLLTPYSGSNKNDPHNDSYNFYLSQLRNHIEMSFGYLVSKWRVLTMPLHVQLINVKPLMMCAVRLHNFCINRRLSSNLSPLNPFDKALDVFIKRLSGKVINVGYLPSTLTPFVGNPGDSYLRERLTKKLEVENIYRPAYNVLKNNNK